MCDAVSPPLLGLMAPTVRGAAQSRGCSDITTPLTRSASPFRAKVFACVVSPRGIGIDANVDDETAAQVRGATMGDVGGWMGDL